MKRHVATELKEGLRAVMGLRLAVLGLHDRSTVLINIDRDTNLVRVGLMIGVEGQPTKFDEMTATWDGNAAAISEQAKQLVDRLSAQES